MYDAIGSASTPAAFFNDLQSAGVKVHAFHTILEGFRRFQPFTFFNRRNHRKLLIIDDTAGYFGGMNIIDNVETVGQLKAQNRPTSSGWRDIHIRLAGPQQGELADSFDRSWRSAQGLPVQNARVPCAAPACSRLPPTTAPPNRSASSTPDRTTASPAPRASTPASSATPESRSPAPWPTLSPPARPSAH